MDKHSEDGNSKAFGWSTILRTYSHFPYTQTAEVLEKVPIDEKRPASPEDDNGGTGGQAEPHAAEVHKPVAIGCCAGIPSPTHFHNSIATDDPHISRIIQVLNDHIWDPSFDPHQPFPHVKDLAGPCTKKMYAEWNLAVNGVLKRFSNEAFMTWKHNKTQEFYQWEEMKPVVDMFVLEQI